MTCLAGWVAQVAVGVIVAVEPGITVTVREGVGLVMLVSVTDSRTIGVGLSTCKVNEGLLQPTRRVLISNTQVKMVSEYRLKAVNPFKPSRR